MGNEKTFLLIGTFALTIFITCKGWGAAFDEAKFTINHPGGVVRTQNFTKAIPKGEAKQLDGLGSKGANVAEIVSTKLASDPNSLIQNSTPGTTRVSMTSNPDAAARNYPMIIGGKYRPISSGGGGGGGDLPDWHGDADANVGGSVEISFTFDDGPHLSATGKTIAIINTLKGKETTLGKPVKATFYTEHSRIKGSFGKSILKNYMVANGHEVGLHGADPITHHRRHQDTPGLAQHLQTMKGIITSSSAGGQVAKSVRPVGGWGLWTSGTQYTKAQVAAIYISVNLNRYTGAGTDGINSWGLLYPSSGNNPPSAVARTAFINAIKARIDTASTGTNVVKLVILMHDLRTPDKDDIGPIITEIENYATTKDVTINYKSVREL